MKADLHLHTSYSYDSLSTPEQIVERCIQVGINCLAVTDHGTISGAVKIKEIAPFPVVIGEEILTTTGDMIGYYLSQDIPNHITAEEAAIRIKEQGGIVCIPHPFTRFRSSALTENNTRILLPYIEIIEVFNARSWNTDYIEEARSFALEHELIMSAGSDAHTIKEIGGVYVEMTEFSDRNSFCQSLSKGKIVGHRANPLVHFDSTAAKIKKKILSGK